MDVDKRIEYFCDNMSKELMDMPIFNIDEIKLKLKTRIILLVKELFKHGVTEKEKYRANLVNELSANIPRWRKLDIQAEISKLNLDIKTDNMVGESLKTYEEYTHLKKFIKENLPKEIIEKYYEEQHKLFNNK